MKDRYRPILRICLLLVAVVLLCTTATGHALADVVGRLKFSVKNAADEKPIAGAKITLKDSANVRPDVTLTTDAQGIATSAPLDARAWQVTTQAPVADTFQPDTRSVTVVADTVTDVEVLLEPLKEKVIIITGQQSRLRPRDTNNDTRRTQTFIKTYPVTGGNPQDLGHVLLSTPGVAQDSVNQFHPRGEHSSTAININGFYLPGALQGRAAPFLNPDNVQTLDVLTGAYAPEYGGETAAILNIDLRRGPIKPLQALSLEGGEFSTYDGALTLGGQFGRPIGTPDTNGRVARRFGYFLDFSARRTQNALEPPQPDPQTAHNTGATLTGFGNFTYQAGSRDEFALLANIAPGYTQIANRTGLPAQFAPVGQGFGYSGARNADGTLAPSIANPGGLGDTTLPLPAQQTTGQDINQRDVNDFGLFQYRHTFSNSLYSLFSFGLVHSGQEIRNGNPAVNLAALPLDNSIEFNPTIIRNYHQAQGQGSLTYNRGHHTAKFGLLYDDQEGDEFYQLIPGSQLALDALFANAPNLSPAGTAQVSAGQPVLDALGNQVYTLAPGATTVPVLNVHRTGFYSAAYLQDTWNLTRLFTANYGVRVDWYKQNQNLGQAGVNQANVSPRINLAYVLSPKSIARLSYNRLFIQPPLAQGAILGAAITPETLDQYDLSFERIVGPGQVFKIAGYLKDIQNQIDTGLLIPGTQIGVFSSVNFTHGQVHGLEFTYDVVPRNNIGFSMYATLTHSLAKPNGLSNTGMPVPDYNDHDQLNTITGGLAYTWKSGANVGFNIYHGSGVASSFLFNTRHPRTYVNLSLGSGPRLFGGGGRGGLALVIENLFDSRQVINFNSGFSGTRFQQGRRILLSASGNF